MIGVIIAYSAVARKRVLRMPNQKSKIKNQKSKIKNQKSKILYAPHCFTCRAFV